MDEWKRSGQIPAFGDWDHANDLPITQYFESARQAGLVARYSSSGECGHHYMRGGDLYAAADFMRSSHNSIPHPRKTRLREKRETHMKEQRKQGRVCDVIEQPRKHHQQRPDPTISHNGKKNSNGDVTFARPRLTVGPPKPVDEDLYRIPPELLRTSKRKKVPGLFSCLVPTCAS
ncbi:hypothetical protein K2173_017566 [Erythroxylum novogranatense]|uniref:Uncharacterized protein n=1 Tax=Erythroxylum novogranatense TaxID=1862640 RepID=A0AAV8T8P1_9ROSI|nr:hypothetical protein K2173_017566 [Erythroxylum novogranatense]